MKSNNIRTFSTNPDLVEERRNQIVRCARQLFDKKGFDRTTMRDLGKACHMTSAGLYHYVGKKDDVLSLVIQDGYKIIYAFIREAGEYSEKHSPPEALALAIDRYYRTVDSHKASALFLSSNYTLFRPSVRLQIDETQENVTAVFHGILKKGCAGSHFSTENPWLCAYNIVGLGQLWAIRANILAKRLTIDEYIRLQTKQLFKQILTRK